MQPLRPEPRSPYLPISIFLLFVLIFLMMRSPSLWGFSVLILIAISFLALHFYHQGMRGILRALLVASGCVACVAVVVSAFLFAALWSWWAFGILALSVVAGTVWLQPHIHTSFSALFVSRSEHSEYPSD